MKVEYRERMLMELAITNGDADMLGYLFDKGLIFDIGENWNWTLLEGVIAQNRAEALFTLFKYGEHMSDDVLNYCLNLAAKYDNIELIALLIDSGADVNAKNNIDIYVPLTIACRNGNIAAATLLFERGANINGTDDSVPLLNAVRKGQSGIVKWLLKNGAKADCREIYEDQSFTEDALTIAVVDGYYDIIVQLVNNGADLEHKNWKSETTAIIVATRHGVSIFKFLVEQGADYKYIDMTGNSAFDEAKRYNNVEVVSYLTALLNMEQ